MTNLGLGLGRFRTGVLRRFSRSRDGRTLLTLPSSVNHLDLGSGLDDEIDNLRLAARFVNPNRWEKFAFPIGKLVELARNVEKSVLKVDVLDKVVL